MNLQNFFWCDMIDVVIYMVIREKYLKRMIDAKDTEFIKVITGVRRSGKSTLLLMFKDYLVHHHVKEENIIYINFESAMYDDIKNYKDGKTMGRFVEMKNEELFDFIKNYIADKIEKNSDEVRYSYFELKVKMDMDESDIDRFLKCSIIILEGLRLQSLLYRIKI